MFRPVAAADLGLTYDDVDPAQVASGAPRTGFAPLAEISGAHVGVWEMTAGGMHDIEADEVFAVVSGSAVVTLLHDNHAVKTIKLCPGDVCRLSAGMTTRWDVADHIRKVYLVAGNEPDAAELST